MKVLLLSFLVVFASGLEDYDGPHWADMVAAETNARPVRAGDVPSEGGNDSCDALYSCQDCKTARVCRPSANGVFETLQTVSCPTDRPYCDPHSGSCVSEEPESCGEKDDSFICMGNGKYPDKDCHRFHACLDLQPVTFQCSGEGMAYNPVTQICEPSTTCGSFDCEVNQGRKVPHSVNAAFFAYCSVDNGPLVVDSCPRNYELNATSQLCEPACNTNGLIADAADCHYYHKCTQITIRRGLSYMQRDRLRCPEGQAYSTKDYLCIAEDQVERCKSAQV